MVKNFSQFINESSEQETMDYLSSVADKPEASGNIDVDTSTNPLWNQIWSALSAVGKPKKITWKDDWGSGPGMASLNWGSVAQRGTGTIGCSVTSGEQKIQFLFNKEEDRESIMKALSQFNFPKIDNRSASQVITVDYAGVKDPQKVVDAVKTVLKSFGLA